VPPRSSSRSQPVSATADAQTDQISVDREPCIKPTSATPDVAITSRREVQWITEDVGRIFPREWDRFVNAIPDHLRHPRPVDAYATMLAGPDPIVRDNAAREWCTWEEAHVSLTPRVGVLHRHQRGHTFAARLDGEAFHHIQLLAMRRAKIVDVADGGGRKEAK
jgi:hypothetical protein